MLEERITELLETRFEGTDYFLVDIKSASKNGRIQVFIDADSQVNIGECAKISRLLEQHLEEDGLVGEKYILEVSSAGLDNPFKLKRQYIKNVGRPIEVILKDGRKLTGVLKQVGESEILLEEQVKKKKGQKPQLIEHQLAFDEIVKAKEKIIF